MGCDEVGVAVLVLDTHVFLWLLGADTRLSAQTREIIEVAAKGGDVRVPVIVAWELGMLTARQRLRLREPLVEWFQAAMETSGLLMADQTVEIVVESTRLPGDPPSDPADCMIVATARRLDATLVTRDRLILDYGAQGHVDVLPA